MGWQSMDKEKNLWDGVDPTTLGIVEFEVL